MAKDYGLNAEGQKADITRGDLVRFYPEDLLPFVGNYRFGATDSDPAVRAERNKEIEAMVVSLCEENQKTPIIIHGVSGSRFQVHAGDTRHQASLRINERGIWPFSNDGKMRIECKVEANGDAKRTFGTSITENIARSNLNLIDVANAVAIATDQYQYSDAEILQKFQQVKPDGTPKDPAWLPNMRRLARLPIERKREIYLGLMAASVGYLLAEIPEDRHAEVLAEAAGEDPHRGIDYFAEEAEAEELMADPTCPDCGPTAPDASGNCSNCHQPYNLENPVAEPTLDYTDSQIKPVITPNVPKKRKARPGKVTARAVAKVAKDKGLLAHKKVGHTLAGIREFWQPYAEDRNTDSRMGQLATATLAWIAGDQNDDAYFKAVAKILKEGK